MKCKNLVGIMCMVGIIVILNIIYVTSKDQNHVQNDPLNKIIYHVPFLSRKNNKFLPNDKPSDINAISGWQISHIVMHFVLNFMFPNCWKHIASMGVLWEVAESFTGQYIDMKEPMNVSFLNTNDEASNEASNDIIGYAKGSWMRGSAMDLIFNTGGALLGYSTRKYFDNSV